MHADKTHCTEMHALEKITINAKHNQKKLQIKKNLQKND